MTRTVGTALAVLALVLTLGGCAGNGDPQVATAGGTDSGGASAGQDQPVLDEEERRQQFVECMRRNGVDMADPEPGDGKSVGGIRDNVDKDTVRAAMDSCRQFLPNGGERFRATPETIEATRQLAECLRGQGIEVSDPDPDTGRMQFPDSADPGDEALERAMQACRHLSPKSGDGG